MPSNPNGDIILNPGYYINRPLFEYKTKSNNTNYYSLKFHLYDSEYKRCQHAVGGNSTENSSTHIWSPVFFQLPYQLPNYVVKIFKKNNTGSTSRLESCWQPLTEFNNVPHLKINSAGSTINTNSFGVGITPYSFYFQTNSYSYFNNGNPIHNYTYNKIGEYNAFDSNDEAYYEFDAKGGFTDYHNNHSQVVRDRATGNLGQGGNAAFGYRIKNAQNLSYNTNDLFHEPGIYLLTIMRNAIHNNHINPGIQYFVRNDIYFSIGDSHCAIRLNESTSIVSQAYLRIDPPSPSITYNPSNDIVSFTFNAYGSVNYNPYNANQRWVISNIYNGKSSFVAGIVDGTEIFPFDFNISINGSNYPVSGVNYIISPSDTANAYITAETTLNNLRLNVNSFNNEIYVHGAFEYDFKLSTDGNANSPFLTYADSNNPEYTNYSIVHPNNNAYWRDLCFYPSYHDWYFHVSKSYRTRNETLYSFFERDKTYTNVLNFSGAIPDSITFNTEFVNINNEYILRSYWTENNANFLTSNLVGSEYTLRLYYKVTNSNTDNVAKKYTDGALINYNYVNNSDTGLNLSASQFNSNNRNVYTDKNGNIFYNNAPANNSSFVGWTEDETKGAILTILQINYTNSTSATNNVPYLKNYGSYIINIPQHRLSYNINSNTGGVQEIYISQPINSYTPLYADSYYSWNILRETTGTTYAIPSSSNDSSPSIEEINNQYIDTSFSNVRFTMSSSSNAINGNYYLDNVRHYGPIFQKIFYPPFYDPNNTNNVIYALPGKQNETTNSVTLDLTQHIQIDRVGSTFYLYVAQMYKSKGTFNSAFDYNEQISLNYLKNDIRYVMLSFYMENYYTAHYIGNIYLNGYILYSSISPDVIINGPFYDLQYNLVTTYEGIDTNGATVTLDLANSAIKLDKETNNERYLVRVSQQGSAANAYDGSFRNNTSVKLLTDLRFSFTMQNPYTHFAAIDGFAIVDNFTFNGTETYLQPPFYNIDGSIATYAIGIKLIYTPSPQYEILDIDLTKKVRIIKYGNTYYLYATSIGQSGDTFDATIYYFNGFKYEYIRSRRRFDYAQVQSNNKTGNVGNTIVNYFDIGPTFTETLGSYGNFNTTSFSNRPNPYTLVNANNNVFTFPYNSDNYFDTSLVKIGSEYLFHSTWIEPHQNKLTSNKINTPYTLRLYNKNPYNTNGNVVEVNHTESFDNYDFSAIKLEFTMQPSIAKVSGLLKINNVYQPFSYFSQDRIFNPPFYDQNNNLVTQFSGITLGGSSTNIDFTKPIKFNDRGTSNTIFVFGTQVGSNGNAYDATFNNSSFVSISSEKTYGLNISNNWKTTSPNYTMEVYTDKDGNIFYNNPPANDTQFVGWSESEISGVNLMILQRNYTPTTSDPLYSLTNGGYDIKVTFSDASINYTSNSNNITPSNFSTENSSLYPNAINNWSITRFSDNVKYSLSSIATNNFTPTISEIDAAYSVSTDKAGALTNYISHIANNYFNIQNTFIENLLFDGRFNTSHHYFNNKTLSRIDITSNPILIFPDNSENYFDSSLVKIGSEYLFHSRWTELYPTYITSHIVNAPYTLRIYNKDTLNTSTSVNDTYTTGTITNYKYNNTNDFGLNISANWKTTSPSYTMDVYTDKDGNIFYNNPPANDTQFVGWTYNDISGSKIVTLQRNYTLTTNEPLYLTTNSSYSVQITDPSLVRINDNDGFMTQLEIRHTNIYPDSSNQWSVYEYDTTNTISIPNSQLNIPNPTRSQINSAYPLRVGPGSIKNTITYKLDVGNTFVENLGVYGKINNSSINNKEQTTLQYVSNNVNIYDTRQTNDSAYNLEKVSYTYLLYDTSKVYFDIDFLDPSSSLLRPEAYDINIFKKTQGTGTAISQWYPNGQYSPYIYQSESNRGITIPNTNVPTELNKYKIDATGQVFSYGQSVNFNGSFETGGYFVVFRRNFYKGTATEPNAKEPFYTLNSQYVYVSPNQENTPNYNLLIYDSSNLLLEDNTQTNKESLNVNTPIYGSYNADGSNIDIDFTFYINFENELFTPKWQTSNLVDTSNNEAIVNVRDLYTDFFGLGDGVFLMDVSYNWSAPSLLSLPIGEIGGIYPTINEAVFNPSLPGYQLTYPINRIVKPNMGVTNSVLLNLPIDSSYARLNEVKDLQAEFIGSDTTRMLAIKWREPDITNLDTTYTGYPYALRLYKKSAIGETENDQWYPRDNSGTAGIYPYRWTPDYYANSPDLSNLTYDGLEISANFFPQITNDNYLYFFADASGIIYYNEYPSNTDLINPFTEPGGYILIVQRHYRDLSNNAVFTTYGQYISFIPTSATNPWPITDTDYPIIVSNPNPYSSFEPLDKGGQQNLQFYWTLEIPNINYNQIIPFEDSSAVNVEKIQQEFRNRGKEAYITSYVTYNFGIENRPFVERYPLLRINGNPNYTTASQKYAINLCSTTVPLTEPEWPRFRPECIDATPEEKEAYQMRRKAETLFHKSNRNDIRVKKKNWYSFVSQGYNQKHQTYATQTDKFTNPNTKNYPILGGRSMTLPADCAKRTITAPSTSSDVPGPAVPLTYDPNVPLINYKVFRTYTNSETEYAEKNKN